MIKFWKITMPISTMKMTKTLITRVWLMNHQPKKLCKSSKRTSKVWKRKKFSAKISPKNRKNLRKTNPWQTIRSFRRKSKTSLILAKMTWVRLVSGLRRQRIATSRMRKRMKKTAISRMFLMKTSQKQILNRKVKGNLKKNQSK